MSDYNAVTEAAKLFPPEDGAERGVDRNAAARSAFILGAGWQAGQMLEVVRNQVTKSQRRATEAQEQIDWSVTGLDQQAMLALWEHNAEASAYRYIHALLSEGLRPRED